VFGGESQVVLNKRRRAIRSAERRLGRHYEAALLESGYITKDGLWQRRVGRVRGGIAVVLALGVLGVLASVLGAGNWIPADILLLLIAWLVSGRDINIDPPYDNPSDYAALERWRVFGRALRYLDREQVPPGQFARLLPYAVATDTEERLIWAYDSNTEPLPSWFISRIDGTLPPYRPRHLSLYMAGYCLLHAIRLMNKKL
jgi:hypothetical protein